MASLSRWLYGGANPYSSAQPRFIDNNYPHTNIRENLINELLISRRPEFWLELGSFVGGSAIKVAESIKKNGVNCSIICCDPFSGDVNMWDWEQNLPVGGRDGNPYKFIGLENGVPTIYQRFLANVFFNGHADVITPIQVTSLVGMKLIERLFRQKRVTQLPSIIYLDSAHEIDEILLELTHAWKCLPSEGILFGDDWSWDAVRSDVQKFSKNVEIHTAMLNDFSEKFNDGHIEENIFLYAGQWVLFKK